MESCQEFMGEILPARREIVVSRLKRRIESYRKHHNQALPLYQQTVGSQYAQEKEQTQLLQQRFLESRAKKTKKEKSLPNPCQPKFNPINVPSNISIPISSTKDAEDRKIKQSSSARHPAEIQVRDTKYQDPMPNVMTLKQEPLSQQSGTEFLSDSFSNLPDGSLNPEILRDLIADVTGQSGDLLVDFNFEDVKSTIATEPSQQPLLCGTGAPKMQPMVRDPGSMSMMDAGSVTQRDREIPNNAPRMDFAVRNGNQMKFVHNVRNGVQEPLSLAPPLNDHHVGNVFSNAMQRQPQQGMPQREHRIQNTLMTTAPRYERHMPNFRPDNHQPAYRDCSQTTTATTTTTTSSPASNADFQRMQQQQHHHQQQVQAPVSYFDNRGSPSEMPIQQNNLMRNADVGNFSRNQLSRPHTMSTRPDGHHHQGFESNSSANYAFAQQNPVYADNRFQPQALRQHHNAELNFWGSSAGTMSQPDSQHRMNSQFTQLPLHNARQHTLEQSTDQSYQDMSRQNHTQSQAPAIDFNNLEFLANIEASSDLINFDPSDSLNMLDDVLG